MDVFLLPGVRLLISHRAVLLHYGVKLLLVLVSRRRFSEKARVADIDISAIHVTYSVYGFWSTRRRTERAFAFASKVVPLVLAGITLGLLQTKAVQSSFLVYMIVANVQCK